MEQQAMGALLAAAAIFVLAWIVALAPARLRRRLITLWALSPAILYWLVIAWEMQSRREDPSSDLENVWAGFYILSAMAAVPWLLLGLIGYGIGRGWRALHARRTVSLASVQQREAASADTLRIRTDDPATLRLGATIVEAADRFGVPRSKLPTIGYVLDGAAPFVFADDQGLHLAFDERGVVIEDRVTRDLDELLYWVFQCATEAMAADRVSTDPRKHKGYTKLFLAEQAELLHAMNPDWEERWRGDRSTLAWRFQQLEAQGGSS